MSGGTRAPQRLIMIDGTFWVMLAVLIGLSALAYSRGGAELVGEGFGEGAQMLVRFSLVLILAFLVAGFAGKLIPQEWVRTALGDDSGLRGIAIAIAAGVITPSGPFVSMPIAASLLELGAGRAAAVAYLTSWMLLSVHRFVAWEVAILGFQFAALRWVACLLLPLAAALLVRGLDR